MVEMKITRLATLAEILFSIAYSSTLKTEQNESGAAVCLSFWCLTRSSVDAGTD